MNPGIEKHDQTISSWKPRVQEYKSDEYRPEKSMVQKRTDLALMSFGGSVSPAKLGWKVAVNLISFGEFAHTCG